MARLDAAAHIIPTLKFNLTASTWASVMNREQATAASDESSVVDREAAVVRARSEFSMISDKPVSVILFRCITDDNPEQVFRQKDLRRAKISAGFHDHCVGHRFTVSRRFSPPNCVRLSPEKQAIASVFCRIRENEDVLLLDLA